MYSSLVYLRVAVSLYYAAKMLRAPAGKSTFMYGTLTNPVIVNNGHTLQVSLPKNFESNVRIPFRGQTSVSTTSACVNTAIMTATAS